MRLLLGFSGMAALFLVGGIELGAEPISDRVWNFDDNQVGQPPSHFSFGRTGQGRPGRWVVQADQAAPSGRNVLAQLDDDPTDYRFPIAVADELELQDLSLSVQCKMVSGQIDQAAGLVFRYQDENNYYITRANALEQNVRFYKVVNGNRQQLASWQGPVTGGVWHELGVQAQGARFLVFWDGKQVMDTHDETFPNAGRVGVWTKADSVTTFDDLLVKPLNP